MLHYYTKLSVVIYNSNAWCEFIAYVGATPWTHSEHHSPTDNVVRFE